MLAVIVLSLLVLWFLGYVRIDGLIVPDITLFQLNSRPVSLWDLLILALVVSLIGILPSPFRQIAMVVLALWILATLGIIAIAGLPSLLIIATIVGLIIYIAEGHR